LLAAHDEQVACGRSRSQFAQRLVASTTIVEATQKQAWISSR
jgi:hypothetical protein